MDSAVRNFLVSFELGRVERHKNMAVFPLETSLDGGPEYVTLKEALEKSSFVITEVSEGGNVPNLKVSNKGKVPVLLLDGEELAGAKQNRVLNTTILVQEGTEIVIPVSCTEQGRWSYAARVFFESGHVMSPAMRSMNKAAVAASLESIREFRGDQGTVWENVHQMEAETGTKSSTGAMKDVFESKMEDLDTSLKAFVCGPQQKGILVIIGREVVGFDFVSRESAFAVLFPKLIKSYAMEAWIAGRKEKKAEGEAAGREEAAEESDAARAREFLAAAAECGEKSYDSVGMGKDVRFDGPGIVGSALVVEDKLVHAAFFSAAESQKVGNMAGPSRRRSFRT